MAVADLFALAQGRSSFASSHLLRMAWSAFFLKDTRSFPMHYTTRVSKEGHVTHKVYPEVFLRHLLMFVTCPDGQSGSFVEGLGVRGYVKHDGSIIILMRAWDPITGKVGHLSRSVAETVG